MFLITRAKKSKRRHALRQAIESLENRVLLAYTLDPSFSGDGISEVAGTRIFTVQPDNKIVALVPDTTTPKIARISTDGSLDTSFGSGGQVTLPFTPMEIGFSNGKILVASRGGLAIARYNLNGTLDTSFGGGDGIAQAPTQHGTTASDMAVAPDGKLVIVGSGREIVDISHPSEDRAYYESARFNADGTLDTSYSGDGVSEQLVPDIHNGGLFAVGVQSDGKIILVGMTSFSVMDGATWWMSRTNVDGTGDSTFQEQGWTNGDITDLEIQSDDKILLIRDLELLRYNANGPLDANLNNSLGNSNVRGSEPLSNGNILVAGLDQSGDSFVARLLSNGQLDTTFAPNGKVNLGSLRPDDVQLDSLSRVITGGFNPLPQGNLAAVARLTSTAQTPFKGSPFNVGDTIQAEDFDTGGEGVAYHDTDAANNGGAYRPTEAVDIETTSDTGGGYNVGWTIPGEWMEYSINLPTTGNYTIDTRLASPKTGGKFHYEIDGVPAGGAISIPNTGSFQSFRTITSDLGNITAGTHVLRLVIDSSSNPGGQANFNWMKINSTSTADTQAPSAVPNFRSTNVTNSSVTLAWDAATDNVGVAGYQIWFYPNSPTLLGPDQRSYTFNELAPDRQYTFEIRAVDAAGNQGPINQVNVTTGSLPITGGIKGEYFNNMDFTAPVLTRTDPNIDFNWGTGAPAPGMDADTFSVRWAGKISVPTTGRYTFYTTTDDGVRLWVNNQLIIDKFVPQAATEWSGSIDLVAGQKYDIRMDYFERSGGAQAKLSWSGPGIVKQIVPASAFSGGGSTGDTQAPSAVSFFNAYRNTQNEIDVQWGPANDNVGVAGYELRLDDGNPTVVGADVRTFAYRNLQPSTTYRLTINAFDAAGNRGPSTTTIVTTPAAQSGNGLTGTYFNNMDFTAPALTRVDPNINFNWAGNSPDADRIGGDTFSVRWTGFITVPTTGRYTFYTTTDDGARLTINGQRIIDKLVPQAATEWSGSIDLVAGQKYSFNMEYFERYGMALAKLEWAGPGISKQVVPQLAFTPT